MTSANNYNPNKATQSPTPEGAMFRSVSMSLAPPPPRFLQTSPILHKSHSVPMPPAPGNSTISTRTTVDTSRIWEKWQVTTLHPVPLYHPLERTAVTLVLSLDTTTTRISNFLRLYNIQGMYSSSQGHVDCFTDALIKFRIQLWQKDSDSIIVEIQRLSGCCIAMQQLRHDLVHAIETGEMSPPHRPAPSTCEFLSNLVEQTTELSVGTPPTKEKECLPSALDICRRLLASPRLDENRLGLESLCVLTDSTKMMSKDVRATCATLWSNDDVTFSTLLEKYFGDLYGELNYIHHQQENVEEEEEEDSAKEFVACLHLLALKVVAQSLEALAAQQLTIDWSSQFWQTVLKALYQNVQCAPRRPLEAAWSIRCLGQLERLEPSILHASFHHHESFSSSSWYDYLKVAHQYGRQHHRSLEQETEQLLGRLGIVH